MTYYIYDSATVINTNISKVFLANLIHRTAIPFFNLNPECLATNEVEQTTLKRCARRRKIIMRSQTGYEQSLPNQRTTIL